MKWLLRILSACVIFLISCQNTYAVCPLCTIAIGASIGILHFLGIDDTIVGLWVGGLIIASSLWLADILRKRNIKLPYLEIWLIILFFVFTIPPLYWTHLIDKPYNTLWGIDKLLLGISIGSVLSLLAVFTDKILRCLNNCKVYFYYQKVILPIAFLSIVSLIFYFITR